MQSYTVQEPTVQVPRGAAGAAGAATGACCCCWCCSAAAAPPGSTRRVARLLCSPARPLPARPLLARPALARPALARPALLGRRSLARRSLTRPPPRFQRLGRLGYDGLRALGQHRTPTSAASVATVSAGTRWTCEVSKRAWVVSATQLTHAARTPGTSGLQARSSDIGHTCRAAGMRQSCRTVGGAPSLVQAVEKGMSEAQSCRQGDDGSIVLRGAHGGRNR